MINKIKLYRFIILLCGLLLFCSPKVYASNGISNEENTVKEIDLDGSFDDSSVLVILDEEHSEVNKDHSSTIFKNISYEEIYDLTANIDLANFDNSFEQILQIKLKKSGKQEVIDIIEKLSIIDGVKYVGPNKYLDVDETPNDPYYNNDNVEESQWAHLNLESEYAWNFSTGSKSVRVGVIDSGISSHLDLNANTLEGYDFVNMVDDDVPGALREDISGHGTHVAGILGAVGNEIIPCGVVGMNWDVSIVPMQVVNEEGKVDVSAWVRAIIFAINSWNTNERISILSMSISSNIPLDELESVLREYDGLIVCSTGNEEQDNDSIFNYPSFYGSNMCTNPINNLISVGRVDINDERPTNANWGENTISIYAPGENVLSTFPEHICTESSDLFFYDGTRMCEMSLTNIQIFEQRIINGTHTLEQLLNNFTDYYSKTPSYYKVSTHHSTGYHYKSGSSMSTPYVSGVAALLLSINSELTACQLKDAIINSAETINISIPITNENDDNTYISTQSVLKLNAFNSVKYVLNNYVNIDSYTLSESCEIEIEKSVPANSTCFDELNGFYKLEVENDKYYEFVIPQIDVVDFSLFSNQFIELPIENELSKNIYPIIYLQKGTYYLKINFKDKCQNGLIDVIIQTRNIANILLDNNNVEYEFTNLAEIGFYKISLNEIYSSGEGVNSTNTSIELYTDSSRETILNTFSINNIDSYAKTETCEDELYVYLPHLDTYYLNVYLHDNYSSLISLTVSYVNENDINYHNRFTGICVDSIFENRSEVNYFEEVKISHRSKIQVDILTSCLNNIIDNSISIYLFKQEYNLLNGENYLTPLLIDEINQNSLSPVFTLILDPGTYYVGYENNENNNLISVAFRRIVDYESNMNGILVADPYYEGYELGSEVNFNNGLCNNFTITEGFTRNVYLMVEDRTNDPMSRLDYDWYTSNDQVATVTKYGTVLGLPVENDTSVIIYAILKEDPSVVYYQEFIILNDLSDELIEIECELSYSFSEENGIYKLNLNNSNSPFPMIIYYNWNVVNNGVEIVTLNNWGIVTSTGKTEVLVVGTYNLNQRVKLIIFLSII